MWREGQFNYARVILGSPAVRHRVPAMVSDLMDTSLAGYSLEGLFFGGSPAPDVLATRAKQVFPNAQLYAFPIRLSGELLNSRTEAKVTD